jgi:hypothetical protein
MSELSVPVTANLTVSVMYRDKELLGKVREDLENKFGEIDHVSPEYSFSEISPYYDPEMGSGIYKVIYSFKKTVDRSFLKDVKIYCVELEKEHTEDGNRMINLDPGLLTLENFILATGKNYSHRIYLGDGVFAEVTLMFGKKNVIRELPWTYRDYLFEPARTFLLELREYYRKKEKEAAHEADSFSSQT